MLYPNTFNERKSLTPRRHRPIITPPVRFVKTSCDNIDIECPVYFQMGKEVVDLSKLNDIEELSITSNIQPLDRVLNEINIILRMLIKDTFNKYTIKYSRLARPGEDCEYLVFNFKNIKHNGFRQMKISKKSRFYKP